MTYETMLAKIQEAHKDVFEYLMKRTDVQMHLDYVRRTEDNGKADADTYSDALEHIEKVAGKMLCPATIKVGDGVTVCLWSDRHAATVIKVTKTTVTVRQDKATLDPNFKPEFIPGGFCAYCTNQHEQSYTYEEDPNGREYTFHWSKKYGRYGQPGDLTLIKGRHEFYDYNF